MNDASRGEFALVRRVFLSCLGLVFAIAFATLYVQLAGLIGSRGILPAADFLEAVRSSS